MVLTSVDLTDCRSDFEPLSSEPSLVVSQDCQPGQSGATASVTRSAGVSRRLQAPTLSRLCGFPMTAEPIGAELILPYRRGEQPDAIIQKPERQFAP